MPLKHVMSDAEFNECLLLHTRTAMSILEKCIQTEFLFHLVTYELAFTDGPTAEPTGTNMMVHLIPQFPGGDEGRALLRSLGRDKADSEAMVQSVFMMCEAWATSWDADKPPPFGQVRDDPKRIEIVAIAGMTVDGRMNQGRIVFTRNDLGCIVPGKSRLVKYGSPEGKTTGNAMLAAFYDGYFDSVREAVRQMRANETNYKYN